MSILFQPTIIKNLELPNRFVRSATNCGGADQNGFVTEKHLDLYAGLAGGGVGLIITGATNVEEQGQILPFQKRITSDDHIPGLKKLTETVHRRGARIAVQLFHGGAEAGKFMETQNKTAVAPAYLENDPYFPFFKAWYRALAEDEIWKIIWAFGQGARRARAAGFDAVQLHGSHGYLFSQFLSPYINRREDQWGGSLENRLRFHHEVLKEIRKQVGEDYPVFIKLGVQDSIPGGLEFDQGREAARLMAAMGFDALEISLGARGSGWEETEFRPGVKRISEEAYYRLWSREIKPVVDVPVMLAGGLRSFELMEEIVQAGDADFVALSRPLIREPHLINDWEKGQRRKSSCVSCNKCIGCLLEAQMVECRGPKKENKKAGTTAA